MNESTLDYLEGIAETEIQKKLIRIFSEKTNSDENLDVILKEILSHIKEEKQ